ncbi:MAG: 2-amino-4-hydroxy-6-hydroxymethyldihydropteridine diphosphokinase, partial [Brevundimonas sp.]
MEKVSANTGVPVAVEIDGAPHPDTAVIVALGCNDKGVWRD